jgi:acyl dehydratase
MEPRQYRIRIHDLVRYAGAGGDFNPIHWNERSARAAGLPGVIAHGMFTMALVGRYVTGWAGGPAAIEEFGVRFSAPVVVPDDDEGTTITVQGQVVQDLGDGRVRIALEVLQEGRPVLRGASRVVRFDP